MKGAYVLIIEISETVDIQIQSLGNVSFQPGSWIYVGSAMGAGSTNLENRIKRHFRSEKTHQGILGSESDSRRMYYSSRNTSE
ncbi:MAG: DUF123 domain-containing protein [Candidatus Thorarchaeota archaeon]|jgi:Uri superfamily endonuclease